MSRLCLLLALLIISADSYAFTTTVHALDASLFSHAEEEVLKQGEEDLARLRTKAAEHADTDISAYATKIMRLESRLNRMRATIWKQSIANRGGANLLGSGMEGSDNQLDEARDIAGLIEVKEMLTHELNLDSSMDIELHVKWNNRLLQVMDLLGSRRRLLRDEAFMLFSKLENEREPGPGRDLIARLLLGISEELKRA